MGLCKAHTKPQPFLNRAGRGLSHDAGGPHKRTPLLGEAFDAPLHRQGGSRATFGRRSGKARGHRLGLAAAGRRSVAVTPPLPGKEADRHIGPEQEQAGANRRAG